MNPGATGRGDGADSRKILCVVPEGSAAPGWIGARHQLEIVHSLDDAGERLEKGASPDLLICTWSDDATRERLARIARGARQARLAVIASYAQLPALVKAGVQELAPFVLNADAAESHLARAIEDALSGMEPSSAPRELAQGAGSPSEVVRHVAELVGSQAGVVIRAPEEDERYRELQLVVPGGAVERIREELRRAWGEPAKPRGALRSRAPRSVARLTGRLRRDQELFVKQVGEASAYLLVLPWQGEERVTLLLGAVAPGRPALSRSELQAIHRAALHECPCFTLPSAPPEVRVWFAKDYGWVVTPDYVGVDRRKRPTSFFNRYAFSGRRQMLPYNSAVFSARFVDRVHPQMVAPIAMYLVLSSIDTALTYRFLHRGPMAELNPLIRALLHWSPAGFAALKNLISLVALLGISRFQLWRIGRSAMWLNVAAYAMLDAYWIFLLRQLW